LTGYAQVTTPNGSGSAPFVWTIQADTAGITNPSPGHFQNPATISTIALNGGNANVLVGVTMYLDTAAGQVTFGDISKGGIGLTSAQLKTWDMTSPLGPVSGPNFLIAGTITDGHDIVTLNGVANTSNGPSPTFQSSIPPPTVTSVANAASNIAPGLPNSGIAQGAIFLIFGFGMGPTDIAIAPAPFQSTSLSNTSVAVTVSGVTVNAPMYYTSASQVAALLPSNTPAGAGTLTVSYSGRTSAPAPITVVPSNAGIFTVGSNGKGPGIVTYADYSLVSASKASTCGGPNTTCGAANPGDTLILWATGLGPVSGVDASGAGLGQNMPNLPLKLWLGGVQAPVLYQGRSGCCVGEDQIVFTVPNNVPTGCSVPLVIQINDQISNSTLMPVAATGRDCVPSNRAFSNAGINQLVNAGPITYADLKLSRDMNVGPGYTDNATLQITKVASYGPGVQPFFVSYADDQPLGSCAVAGALNPGTTTPPIGTANVDAGLSFTVNGPNGSKTLTASTTTLSAAGNYLSPGPYTLSSVGGADIGAINAPVTVYAPPTLTNPATIGLPPVTRSNGLTVSWIGGAANARMQVQVSAATDGSYKNGATVTCEVAATAGTMTIPASALLALPAGNFGGVLFRQRTESGFTAKGLSLGVIETYNAAIFIGNVTLK
jgi:uncharacterized protein (TIGR03437 family)